MLSLEWASTEWISLTADARTQINCHRTHIFIYRKREAQIEIDRRIIDTSFSRDDPKSAFEAFLDSQVIKPVFTFSEE